MANGHGGYRKPANPAPVSGPGKYSKRTDGGPAQSISTVPDQPYGQAGQDRAAQRVAPMGGQAPLPPSAAPPAPSQGAPQGGPGYQGGAFNAPTQQPNVPVTAGADAGPGPGSEALSSVQSAQPMPTGAITNLLAQLSPGDTTGTLAQLYIMAQQRGV